jgi:hypothetical protein
MTIIFLMNIPDFEYIDNFSYIVSPCCNVSLINHTERISCEMNRVTLVIGLAITLAIGIAIGLVQQQDARGIGIIVHGADANGANGGTANGANGGIANGANGTNANGASGNNSNGANGVNTHGPNGINGNAVANSGVFVN